MTNLEKFENAFIEAFMIEKDQLTGLEYQSITAWDSVGHMALVAALEDAFDIMMEMDDIIDMGSFEIAKETVKKYDVEL